MLHKIAHKKGRRAHNWRSCEGLLLLETPIQMLPALRAQWKMTRALPHLGRLKVDGAYLCTGQCYCSALLSV